MLPAAFLSFSNQEPSLSTKTKTDAAISPAVAAQQAAWHVWQSARYYRDSALNFGSPSAREINRKRFLTNARLALPTLGLDEFLRQFQIHNGGDYREAEPIIRE